MPKPLVFKVVGYVLEVVGRWYRVRVSKVERQAGKKSLRVALQHLHKDQEGRVRYMSLPLPIRLNGQAAKFFRACGCNVEAEVAIPAADVIGKVLKVKFEASADGDREVVAFKPCNKEEVK